MATTPERSSYNGLILMVFVLWSALLATWGIRGLASRRTRRAIPWGCGYPEASPNTQYSAGSLAQPIRRVFASVLFGARETVDMPRPGDLRPAHHRLLLRDPVWDTLYKPLAAAVQWTAGVVNLARYLSIRQDICMVYAALILLLGVLALWQ